MTYTDIFSEIVSIMGEDSSTYPDYGSGEYGKYSKITKIDGRTIY